MLATEREAAPTTKRLTAAVVVCTASHARKPVLRACVDSLLAGTRAPDELIVNRRQQSVAQG
jgi:hypothetical protein